MMNNTNNSDDTENETDEQTTEQVQEQIGQPALPTGGKFGMFANMIGARSGNLNKYQTLSLGFVAGYQFPQYAELVVVYSIGRTEFKREIDDFQTFKELVDEPAGAVFGVVLGMFARTHAEGLNLW